jgi:hypothetical protein
MVIKETKVEVFQLFCEWLYTQTLYDDKGDQNEWPGLWMLAKLHIFADMARVPRLMNHTLMAFNAISNAKKVLPRPTVISEVWQSLPEGSRFHQYLLAELVWNSNAESFLENFKHFPEGLQGALLSSMSMRIREFKKDSARAEKAILQLRLDEYLESENPPRK